MGLLDDFFGEQGLDVPNPTMTKDEYINQAREWIAKVNDIYWRNWGYRTLNDDELPSEEVCESCNNHCVITIGEYTYDCHPDHESGVCRIRVFDEGNYSDEMEELMNEFDYMDLINPKVELTDLKPVEIPEMPNNTFSGQSTPDLCCGVYEERPLELRICTRCGKEFKSNVDCPICPSCYL